MHNVRQQLEAIEHGFDASTIRELITQAQNMLLREFDGALFSCALNAATKYRELQLVQQLLDWALESGHDISISPPYRLLRACSDGKLGHIEHWLEKVRILGRIPVQLVEMLCRSLIASQSSHLVPGLLRTCELRAASHVELSRLERLCRTVIDDSKQPLLRVWMTGTVTMAPMTAALRLGLLAGGFSPEVELGRFGMLHQDLRDARNGAIEFEPDFVVLGYDVSGLVPELTQARRDLSSAGVHIKAGIQRLSDSIHAWRQCSTARIILHTVLRQELCQLGFCDWQNPQGAAVLQAKINQSLAEITKTHSGVYLVDLDALYATAGLSRVVSERRRLYGSIPGSPNGMDMWGMLVADCIRVAKHGPRKVVICDLDDTMWGGIVGEMGPQSVQVGPDFPGNAFLEFQRTLLDLKSQGILLALCSKNDPETALAAFRTHPHMAVRLSDVASHRIGWDDKPTAIAEIAQELNLALGSFVFLDDSPQERAAVRHAFQEVLVPELPPDPVDRPAFVRSLRELWPLYLTEDDAKRTEFYQTQQQRQQLRSRSNDLQEFLNSLGQVLTPRRIRKSDGSRIAQMHQRTNQFNMTSRRHDEGMLRKLQSRGWIIYVASLEDCFGDQGIVITSVIEPDDGYWRLDTFLMSCRVIGRGVESAFMKFIVDQARQAGIARLTGEHIPTARNGPAADLYKRMGFVASRTSSSSPESREWELHVQEAVIDTEAVRIISDTSIEIAQAACK